MTAFKCRSVCLTVLAILILWGPLRLPAAAQASPEQSHPDHPKEDLTLNFNDVDIQIFIKFISDITGLNLVVDNRVKGKITIFSPAGISVEEAYQVFESVLDVHGYAAVRSGHIVKVLPQPVARTKNIETRDQQSTGGPSDRLVTQIVRLKHVAAGEIKRILTPLVSPHSAVLAHDVSGLLIITDLQSNLQRLMKIIAVMDAPTAGRRINVIRLTHAKANNIKPIISAMFPPASKDTDLNGVVLVQTDPRTNTLIIMANPGVMQKIENLVAELDKQAVAAAGQMHVYYLENADAESLATTLRELMANESASAEEGAATSEPIIRNVKIAADKTTNSLIVMASPETYALIEPIIQKLDIPRAMVYLEALIMEVSTDKDFRLGTEWVGGGETDIGSKEGVVFGAFGGGSGTGENGFPNLGSAVVSGIPGGFSVGVISELIEIGDVVFPNIGAVVQAYKEDQDVNILSTPQILATDNEEAQITVGRNFPFQTQATTSDNNTFNSFEYRDVGKILRITPHIRKDRTIRLKLTLEVTEVESNEDFRPTTLKRTVDTTLLVKDKHTVVIGGLIDESFQNTAYQVPCLGDIPIAGWAFKSMGDIKSQTNLYIFLTPHVLLDDVAADKLQQEKQDAMQKVRQRHQEAKDPILEKLQ